MSTLKSNFEFFQTYVLGQRGPNKTTFWPWQAFSHWGWLLSVPSWRGALRAGRGVQSETGTVSLVLAGACSPAAAAGRFKLYSPTRYICMAKAMIWGVSREVEWLVVAYYLPLSPPTSQQERGKGGRRYNLPSQMQHRMWPVLKLFSYCKLIKYWIVNYDYSCNHVILPWKSHKFT